MTRQLAAFHFLVHGFCYDGMARTPGDKPPMFAAYLARERACTEAWYAGLRRMTDGEALVVVPGPRDGVASRFYEEAAATLGPRCFMLDCPGYANPPFKPCPEMRHDPRVVEELGAEPVSPPAEWNWEEVQTVLHSRACCRQFRSRLAERGLAFDPAAAAADAWGASFDGCVTKYSLLLRRMLGLSRQVEIPFDLTVPDAPFLLDAAWRETIGLDGGLRLYLFERERQVIGLYTFTRHSLSDPCATVTVNGLPEGVIVRSKQGTRLWPDPEPYVLPDVPPEFREPPVQVVRAAGKGLRVPVSAGYVYRLAKAPAYIFMPEGMALSEARAVLAAAVWS